MKTYTIEPCVRFFAILETLRAHKIYANIRSEVGSDFYVRLSISNVWGYRSLALKVTHGIRLCPSSAYLASSIREWVKSVHLVLSGEDSSPSSALAQVLNMSMSDNLRQEVMLWLACATLGQFPRDYDVLARLMPSQNQYAVRAWERIEDNERRGAFERMVIANPAQQLESSFGELQLRLWDESLVVGYAHPCLYFEIPSVNDGSSRLEKYFVRGARE